MTSPEVVLYQVENHIATITLNRPEKLNAMNDAVFEGLDRVIARVWDDPQVRVVIITGAGRGFSSGADVSESLARRIDEPGPALPLARQGTVRFIPTLRRLPQPVIAAVNGVAAGVGMSLALACDLRLAAESARFTAAWVRRGFIPDGGGTFLLPFLMGLPQALEFAWTGDIIDAAEAHRLGLVNRVVPDQELMPTVMDLAQRLAAGPPLAIARVKEALYRAIAFPLEEAISFEGYVQNVLMKTEDFAEGVRSFLEKRQPRFVGR